ncbi:hypothetical protein WISP_46678 [Willisornis vidua]|uniref:Uncharacterized protein n=1 Tax=Willisornis vidua TaxID=1566151 RepID=A0ABQ9DI06_9PASS|nr:hypothetical protein WISP_46678 [Willisornis vidua]
MLQGVDILAKANLQVTYQLDLCIQLWGHQHRKDMDLLERIQRKDTKLIRGMEHLCSEEKLRELELFSLEKEA